MYLRSFFQLSSVFAFGLPLAVISNIVLARILPAAEFGEYGIAIAFASILAIPIVSGMPLLLMREVSSYSAQKRWASYRALMLSAWGLAATYALLSFTGLKFYVHATRYETILGMSTDWLPISFFISQAMCGIAIASGALRGFGYPSYAAVAQQILMQILLIAGFLALFRFGEISSYRAIEWYLAASICTTLTLFVLLAVKSPVDPDFKKLDFTDRSRWQIAYVPFMFIGAMTILTTNIAVLLMGYFGFQEGVAQLRVAEKGAQLVAFPLTIMNIIIGPKIVEHWQSEDLDGLKKLAHYSAKALFLITFPIFLILVVFGQHILGLTFGDGYADAAYWPMVILVVANFISSTLGSSGQILVMTGNERMIVIGQIVGLATLIVFGVLLIPNLGALGGAISAAIALLAAKFILTVGLWHRLSIWSGLTL